MKLLQLVLSKSKSSSFKVCKISVYSNENFPLIDIINSEKFFVNPKNCQNLMHFKPIPNQTRNIHTETRLKPPKIKENLCNRSTLPRTERIKTKYGTFKASANSTGKKLHQYYLTATYLTGLLNPIQDPTCN